MNMESEHLRFEGSDGKSIDPNTGLIIHAPEPKETQTQWLRARRDYVLKELGKLSPAIKTHVEAGGVIGQMRYLQGQLDLIEILLSSQAERNRP